MGMTPCWWARLAELLRDAESAPEVWQWSGEPWAKCARMAEFLAKDTGIGSEYPPEDEVWYP